MAEGLSHLNERGDAHMVDVGEKTPTERLAVAEALVSMAPAVRDRLFAGDLPKGDALAVARVAGIMAAKQTPRLVPLCHPIPIDGVEVEIDRIDTGARVVAKTTTTAKTGIEMEAITAAAIAAVTLYDMVKGIDRGVEIGPIRLLHKSGGKSGTWDR